MMQCCIFILKCTKVCNIVKHKHDLYLVECTKEKNNVRVSNPSKRHSLRQHKSDAGFKCLNLMVVINHKIVWQITIIPLVHVVLIKVRKYSFLKQMIVVICASKRCSYFNILVHEILIELGESWQNINGNIVLSQNEEEDVLVKVCHIL